jgi:DNA-binding MarR family transcriptional regulator
MTSKEIIITVLNHFFDFDNLNGNRDEYSLSEFTGYLNSKAGRDDIEMRRISGEMADSIPEYTRKTLSDISILIVLMNRYARGYIKQAMQDSLLHTPDEFSFLITLMTFKSLHKSELIKRQVMEKTSGTEVIRRLLKKGMIKESADQNDKRSKKISITKYGRDEVLRILPIMSNVSEIIAGNLSNEEINTLSYLLKKLDHFHNDIYMNKKEMSLNDILQKINGDSA